MSSGRAVKAFSLPQSKARLPPTNPAENRQLQMLLARPGGPMRSAAIRVPWRWCQIRRVMRWSARQYARRDGGPLTQPVAKGCCNRSGARRSCAPGTARFLQTPKPGTRVRFGPIQMNGSIAARLRDQAGNGLVWSGFQPLFVLLLQAAPAVPERFGCKPACAREQNVEVHVPAGAHVQQS